MCQTYNINYPDLLYLGYCRLMPPSEGLDGEGDEDHALSLTGLPGLPTLPVEGLLQGITRVDGCLVNHGNLQGVHHCHVEGRVATTCPVREKDISRAGVRARQESSLFSHRCEGSTCGSVVESIAEMVVASYTLSLVPTRDGVVAVLVAGLRAGGALPGCCVERGTQTI